MDNNSLMTRPRQPLVSKADGSRIVVEVYGTPYDAVLHGLGFTLRSTSPSRIFEMSVASDKEKADVLSKLRDAGIAFSRGKEWCPAEVFEWLRDQGSTRGPFQSISWCGPGQWVVRQEP